MTRQVDAYYNASVSTTITEQILLFANIHIVLFWYSCDLCFGKTDKINI